MNMEKIANEYLSIEVSALGAELQSIRDAEGREYLWHADDRYWPRHSPILFPIVCGLWEGKYRTKGKEYAMGRHGFARDTTFKLIKKTDNKLTYVLESNEETLKQYPYHFTLSVTYRLDGPVIHVVWHVYNSDKEEIHFQIGGHPAFLVPGIDEGAPLKGTLRFDNQGPIGRLYGNVGGCIQKKHHPLDCAEGLWSFTEESFKDDAVIIDESQLHEISLLDQQMQPVVTVGFNSPAVGLWSPYGKNAPFVCIEPWYGIHDLVGYQGEFAGKYLMNHLLPGASFMSDYTIKIG
jgi:galactose mutarotase-like enzyme